MSQEGLQVAEGRASVKDLIHQTLESPMETPFSVFSIYSFTNISQYNDFSKVIIQN